MWLWVSMAIAGVAAVVTTFTSRMQATSLWLGRALIPAQLESAAPTGVQDAVNAGWPSAVGLVGSLLPLVVVGVGFLHAWWAACLAVAVYVIAAALVARTRLVASGVDYYILLFLQHASRREATYRLRGDMARADAAADLVRELTGVLGMYAGSGVPAPSMTLARSSPAGEVGALLGTGTTPASEASPHA